MKHLTCKIGALLIIATVVPSIAGSEADSLTDSDTKTARPETSLNLDHEAILVDGRRPTSFEVTQNYPNPFNSKTLMEYNVPYETDIYITVHNIFGLPVKHLVRRQQQPGRYVVQWDGEDDGSNSLASGVYFSVVVAGEYAAVRKMVLLK